jgi:hypothetical protein
LSGVAARKIELYAIARRILHEELHDVRAWYLGPPVDHGRAAKMRFKVREPGATEGDVIEGTVPCVSGARGIYRFYQVQDRKIIEVKPVTIEVERGTRPDFQANHSYIEIAQLAEKLAVGAQVEMIERPGWHITF